jgi:hypothetical protein
MNALKIKKYNTVGRTMHIKFSEPTKNADPMSHLTECVTALPEHLARDVDDAAKVGSSGVISTNASKSGENSVTKSFTVCSENSCRVPEQREKSPGDGRNYNRMIVSLHANELLNVERTYFGRHNRCECTKGCKNKRCGCKRKSKLCTE